MATDENKRERFQRLAPQRINVVLEKLRILGNCANPLIYEYTEEEVKLIMDEVLNSLAELEQRFLNHNGKNFEF